jgi:lipid-binding SYLF domain-containing protein
LFAGVNLKGVVIRPEDDLNLAVYDKRAHELLIDDGKDPAHEAAGLPTFSQTVARYSTASAADEKSARQ